MMSTCPSSPLGVKIAAIAVLLISGCGDSHPTTVPVTGRVLLDGEPCHTAMVLLQPSAGRPASGRTDAQGRFSLSTFALDDGAIPGDHVVAITLYYDEPPDENDPAHGQSQVNSLIPLQYQAVDTSPLRTSVKLGQSNELLFELKP